jgi:hypothetical protein
VICLPRKRKEKISRINLKNIVLIALFAIFSVQVIVTASTIYSIRESTRPALLSMVRIVDANCLTCTTVGSLSDPIKNNSDVKLGDVKTLEFSSLDAKALIMKYNITRVPALIVSGEFKKDNVVSIWGQLGARMLPDAVIIEANPPYVDTSNSQEVGLVSVTYLVDSSCTVCVNLTGVVNTLEQGGMAVSKITTIEYTSPQGQQEILNHDIKHIPALVFSNDIAAYPQIVQLFAQINATERNGSYALHATDPPYLDLTQNKVVGLVNVILLNDSSCKTCYDLNLHLQILARFNVQISNTQNIDISSTDGQNLLSKYNITKVPTLLVSPDAVLYQNLNAVWPQVGTVASDGWFVFRSAEVMGIYHELSTGKIINPQNSTQSQ